MNKYWQIIYYFLCICRNFPIEQSCVKTAYASSSCSQNNTYKPEMCPISRPRPITVTLPHREYWEQTDACGWHCGAGTLMICSHPLLNIILDTLSLWLTLAFQTSGLISQHCPLNVVWFFRRVVGRVGEHCGAGQEHPRPAHVVAVLSQGNLKIRKLFTCVPQKQLKKLHL